MDAGLRTEKERQPARVRTHILSNLYMFQLIIFVFFY